LIPLSRSEEIVLLAIWKLEDNAYGVTIRDLVSEEMGHEWSFGAIYKPLKQLTHKQYVEKKASEPTNDRGGRTKFLYTITPEGEEALRILRRIQDTIWTKKSKLAFK
jgi:DNA-binding PadR family transcriptional regulator